MNPFHDLTDLPPPTAGEIARRQQQLEPPRRYPTLKILGIVAVAVIGLGVLTAFNDEDESSTSVSAADIDQTALEVVWGGKSADDRASLCFGYNTAPELMWDSFNEGAERQMSRATWERFFDDHC